MERRVSHVQCRCSPAELYLLLSNTGHVSKIMNADIRTIRDLTHSAQSRQETNCSILSMSFNKSVLYEEPETLL